MITFKMFLEAGKVHRVPPHSLTPRHQETPEPAHGRYNYATMRDRREDEQMTSAELWKIPGYGSTGDFDTDGETYFHTLVWSDRANHFSHKQLMNYHGISLTFDADGTVGGSTADDWAAREWAKDKQEIIHAAKKGGGKRLRDFLAGKGRPGFDNGMPHPGDD